MALVRDDGLFGSFVHCEHTHAHRDTHTETHTHTDTHTHRHTQTHRHTHTLTHAHTHSNTRTHTHTHTTFFGISPSPRWHARIARVVSRTFLLAECCRSSLIWTLSCCNLLFISLEQLTFTASSMWHALYSTNGRLSISSTRSRPPSSRATRPSAAMGRAVHSHIPTIPQCVSALTVSASQWCCRRTLSTSTAPL